jgi:hypothetical protein
MRFINGFTVLCAALLTRLSLPAQSDAIEAGIDALGANTVATLRFAASGATFTLGQNFRPNDPWPRVMLTRYTALAD